MSSYNLNSLFPFLGSSTEHMISQISKLTKQKPYQYQVWVYSCVSLISNNLSGLSRYIYDKRTGEKIDQHPVLDLLTKSNQETFGDTLLESIVVNMLLDGQVFILPGDKERLGAGRIPRELYSIQDKYMDAIYNDKNIIAKWKYSPSSTKRIPYNSDEIIRFRFYNPYDSKKGMAPLMSALFTVYQDASAMSYTANFFKNNAQIGGVLSTGEKLNEAQARSISKEFAEKFAGEDKAGKTPILHSGLNYQAISSTFKDMQYKDQQEFVKERILAAFKVPRSLVADYSDVNYSNSVTAKKTFWQEGLLPIDTLINQAFTHQWVNAINPDWELRSDLSTVEALQEIAGTKISDYKTLIDSGLPREEAARILNIPIDWEYVEEVEQEQEEPEEPMSSEEPDNEEDDEKSIDIEAYTKTLKSSLNKYFTKLRNKCLDKIDADAVIDYDIEEEFESLTEDLKSAYLTIIKGILEEITDVAVSAQDIIKFLNNRSVGYKELLKAMLDKARETKDKRAIHEAFQDIYKIDRDIATRDLRLLVNYIKNAEVQTDEALIQQQNGEEL